MVILWKIVKENQPKKLEKRTKTSQCKTQLLKHKLCNFIKNCKREPTEKNALNVRILSAKQKNIELGCSRWEEKKKTC